jgi:hypothetical protein
VKIPIKVKVRRGDDKLVTEDAILWIDELPLEYCRGRNRRMKSRRYKREGSERRLEERLEAKRPPARVS